VDDERRVQGEAPGGGEAAADGFATALGCTADIPACLRSKSTDALLTAPIRFRAGVSAFPAEGDVPPDGAGWKYPVIDGSVLPDSPLALLGSPVHNDVPVVMSNCRDEFENKTLSAGLKIDEISNAEEFQARAKTMFGSSYADEVLAEYPVAAYASPRHAMVHLASDAGYICCPSPRSHPTPAWIHAALGSPIPAHLIG
jgi:carboxylesterase type B